MDVAHCANHVVEDGYECAVDFFACRPEALLDAVKVAICDAEPRRWRWISQAFADRLSWAYWDFAEVLRCAQDDKGGCALFLGSQREAGICSRLFGFCAAVRCSTVAARDWRMNAIFLYRAVPLRESEAKLGGTWEKPVGAEVAIGDEPNLVLIVGEDEEGVARFREGKGAEDEIGEALGEAVEKGTRRGRERCLELLDYDVKAGLNGDHISRGSAKVLLFIGSMVG